MARAGRPLDRERWALTAALLALAVLWLSPIAWVVATSLKPSADIIRLPPEWIPWPATLTHYHEVLLGSSRTARIGRAFANSLVVATGSVLVVLATSAMAAYPLARMRFPGRDLVFAGGQPDDPERGAARPPVRAHPAARLAQHLPGPDRAGGGDALRVRGLPAAPVLPHHAARAGGCGLDRWRGSMASLLSDNLAALAAGAGRARHLRLPLGVERLPVAADRGEQAGDVPAAGGPGPLAQRLQLRVLRADHGRRRPERAAPPGRLHRRQPPHRRGRPPQRPQGLTRERRPRLTARPAPGSAAAARAAPRSGPPPASPRAA